MAHDGGRPRFESVSDFSRASHQSSSEAAAARTSSLSILNGGVNGKPKRCKASQLVCKREGSYREAHREAFALVGAGPIRSATPARREFLAGLGRRPGDRRWHLCRGQ